MRYLLILLLAISCNALKQVTIHDTVYVDKPVITTAFIPCNTDSITHVIDSMHSRIDTYAKLLLRERGKIEQVRKYFRIVHTKEDQLRFIRGWVNRGTGD